MSNELSEWNGGGSPRPVLRPIARVSPAIPLAGMAFREGRRHPVLLAAAFAAIAFAALMLGLSAPKKYTSTASVRVQEESIIQPLMKGRAMSTTVVDHAGIAREIAFGQQVLDAVIRAGGWPRDAMTAVEIERLRDQIAARTEIYNPRQNNNLIKISYADGDPQRARRVAQQFADSIIAVNLKSKAAESRTAYEFIDAQTRQYEKDLGEAESALAGYYREHPDALPGTSESSSRRISELQRETDRARMDAIDQRAQASALQSHLSRENSIGNTGARAIQIQQQLANLQKELDTLSLNYTEQHPDVRRIRSQMGDLRNELQRERRNPSPALSAVAATATPAYSDLRARLADARGRSRASAERVATAERLIAEERLRNEQLATMEGELAQLQRDYDTSKSLYNDMVERRENARMSMLLDAEHGELSFRIQEAAALPLQATGLRLMYVALGGLVIAVALPALALLAWIKLDPRVRTATQIESSAGLPVLGSVPASYTPSRVAAIRKHMMVAAALVASVPLAFALAMILR
ncbi:XrtA system polysaccharide chain length determinant [Marilutibacter maris]|uniref:XrtA system polysaccharide chain length determinant n=1 Tax=Marilutibacter maris TaxID=1605891 RepID=UPI000DAA9CBE|nr:XrtA system polysaccharide chain length determinant [Lysobacter maris]